MVYGCIWVVNGSIWRYTVVYGGIWWYMGGIWVVYGRYMAVYGGIWVVYGWYMGGIWCILLLSSGNVVVIDFNGMCMACIWDKQVLDNFSSSYCFRYPARKTYSRCKQTQR